MEDRDKYPVRRESAWEPVGERVQVSVQGTPSAACVESQGSPPAAPDDPAVKAATKLLRARGKFNWIVLECRTLLNYGSQDASSRQVIQQILDVAEEGEALLLSIIPESDLR
jgi:hypothetical protein